MAQRGGVEVVVPLPAVVRPLSRLRSTLVISSLQSLKTRGHYDAYLERVPAAARDAILFAVAGSWLPIDLVMTHYAACDSLGLSSEEQIAMGKAVGHRVNGTVLGTAVRLARTAGATPWNVLSQLPRFYERGFDGGALEVLKLAPKDARVRAVNVQLARLAYFRNGLVGVLGAFLEPFSRRAFVRLGACDDTTVSFEVQWA